MQSADKKSALRFVSKVNSDPVPALAHAQISASSAELGWKGLYLEVGTNFGCDVDELMVDGHFVGLQLNDGPIPISTRTSGSWIDTMMPPGTLWLHPEGSPFSIRHSIHSYWAGAVIDGQFLDSQLGGHYELSSSYVVRDDVLSHQLLAMIELLRQNLRSGVNDPTTAAALIRSFVVSLGKRHGRPVTHASGGGNIAEHQLKALLTWVERNLGRALTVEAMAQRVDLSVAHFSREFKRALGSTPWHYVMERRLTMAHDRLRQGHSASSVAYECGFSDQSHLSRAIRSRFGVSPGEISEKRTR